MLREVTHTVGEENFPNENLFAVVDEAQVAAEYLNVFFRSFTTGIDMRPVLHGFHRFLWDTKIFRGVILAGTSLSMKIVPQQGLLKSQNTWAHAQIPLFSLRLDDSPRMGQIIGTTSTSTFLFPTAASLISD
jgi:hypothetical protein